MLIIEVVERGERRGGRREAVLIWIDFISFSFFHYFIELNFFLKHLIGPLV